ncbi:MAG: glycosyltransferase family 4 protein [Chloroflexaceae bacterium]
MTTPVDPALLAAEYHLDAPLPAGLFAGEALIVEVTLRNTGRAPWLTGGAHPVRLGYRWLNGRGEPVVADGGRALLPAPVPPGMTARAEIRVESPPLPGRYELQVELLEEGVAWFSQRGVAPLRLEVTFAPPTAPRVAILNGNVIAHDAVGSHIVAQLETLRAAGYHTLVLTGFVDSRLPADVRRSMVMVSPEHLRDAASASAAALHFRQADLVIVNYSSYYDLVELIRDVRRGVVLFDYHGITPPELWGPAWPGYQDLVRGRDNLALVRYADYAIGHSRFTCDELIATGQIAASRVVLMPYAVVEASGYAGAPDPAVVERFGLAGQHVLLYVGRIARNKRVSDLVEAMPAILERHPATVLLIVGDDQAPAYRAYADEVRARAVALGVAEQVHFTGQVDDATLENLYRACAVFVTASIHEGFGMPVVEAMARGRPVVAADSTALPHTLDGAGLLFPPGEWAHLAAQVCRLLDDLPPPDDHHDPLALHRLAPAGPTDLAALRRGKIAIVTPRYGPQVLGGAETGLRSWAEHLAARGYQVEALTTCTVDMADWSDHLTPGVEHLNGVTVRRFSTTPVEATVFHRLLQKANRGERLRYAEERQFVANSLRSADLERYIAEHAGEYVCFIAGPYLFGTSYWPALSATAPWLLVPCLHDEPVAYLSIFRELLERSAALLFNTPAESALASQGLGVVNPYRACLGFGFADDPPVGDAARFRARTDLTGPFILYSGRLEPAKNVPLLLEWFAAYKAERSAPLTLVLTGTGSVTLPERADVVSVGHLDDRDLHDAYAAATALCQLSLNESFSIVLMEAWLQGCPAIVHADCPVTRGHIERSGGGYAADTYPAFRAALDALLSDPDHRAILGARGRAYVRAEYSWSALLPRIEEALARLSRPRGLYARLAQRGVSRALAFTRQRFADELLTLVEQALGDWPATFIAVRQETLRHVARVTRPDYQVRSRVPVAGPLIAWLRRQLTAHLKEPYLDPVIASQERFNRDLLETLLPLLDASLREQRLLRAEVERLRDRLNDRQGEGC